MHHTLLSNVVALGAAGMAGALVAACAVGSQPNTFSSSSSSVNGGAGGTASTGSTTGQTGGSGGDTVVTISTASGSGGEPAMVYAHTADTLFQFDPQKTPIAMTEVGAFDCIGSSGSTLDNAMTDIAVSSQGELWGVTSKNAYPLEIQGSTVHCGTPIALPVGASFFGLTFAPTGALDATQEVLVAGNTAGELWSIQNGSVVQRGTLGVVPADDGHGHAYVNNTVGKPWELSGDIVFLTNNGSPVGFATVRNCPNPPSKTGCNTTDTLIEINVAALKVATTQSVMLNVRGPIVTKPQGCANPGTAGTFGALYGIAAWNDKVYGFSLAGSVIEIDNVDGTACEVATTPLHAWYGAGVTTSAPVLVPN